MDTSIPMSGVSLDTANPLMNFYKIGRQKKLDARQEQMDAQTQEMNGLKIASQKLDNMDQREKQRFDSLINGAAELQPYLESGDIEGAKAWAKQRRINLGKMIAEGGNVDTVQTDHVIQALDAADPNELNTLKTQVGQLVKLGQLRGTLKNPGQDSTSAIQNYEYYKALPDDKSRDAFTGLIRQTKTVDLGDKIGAVDAQGNIIAYFPKSLAPADQPVNAGNKSRAVEDQKNISDRNFAKPIAFETASGRAAGETQGFRDKTAVNAGDNIAIIDDILKKDANGKTLLDKASGSVVGAGFAAGKKFVGTSDESTQANAALKVYGGKLLNNVPRMEGPQSDADRESYAEQAGKIADPTMPAGDKLMALMTIRDISKKYAAQNTSDVQPIQGDNSLPDSAGVEPRSPGMSLDQGQGWHTLPSGVKYRVKK